jgi:hypothetical protein
MKTQGRDTCVTKKHPFRGIIFLAIGKVFIASGVNRYAMGLGTMHTILGGIFLVGARVAYDTAA